MSPFRRSHCYFPLRSQSLSGKTDRGREPCEIVTENHHSSATQSLSSASGWSWSASNCFGFSMNWNLGPLRRSTCPSSCLSALGLCPSSPGHVADSDSLSLSSTCFETDYTSYFFWPPPWCCPFASDFARPSSHLHYVGWRKTHSFGSFGSCLGMMAACFCRRCHETACDLTAFYCDNCCFAGYWSSRSSCRQCSSDDSMPGCPDARWSHFLSEGCPAPPWWVISVMDFV